MQRLLLAACGVMLPAAAFAQDAGAPDAPQVNPMSVVMAARGDAVTVFSDTRRHRGPEAYERTLRLPLVRYRCYELLGFATGATFAFAQVTVGRAPLEEALPLNSNVGRVARLPFCVREPADLYSLTMRADGPAWWYVTLVQRDAQVAPAERTTEGPAPAAHEGLRAPTDQYVIGGDVQDYVSRQVQMFARQRPGVTGFTPLVRQTLPTNGAYESPLVIPSGRCVDVVAVGVPSVADLVMELDDPAGRRVAQDAARRANENIRYCAPYAGTFRLRVRVFSGAGLVGVQTLLEP